MITENMVNTTLAGKLFINEDGLGKVYYTYGGVEFESTGEHIKYSFIDTNKKLNVIIINRYAKFISNNNLV